MQLLLKDLIYGTSVPLAEALHLNLHRSLKGLNLD